MIGVIRVFTTEDEKILNHHGEIISERYGVSTVSKCITDQPYGVFNDETEKTAVPKIIQLGKKMEQEGCKVLVISCAADPAIEELRKEVTIPVIGAGSAAALSALAIGQSVGVLGITDEVPLAIKKLLGELLISYQKVQGIGNTTDLLTPSGRQQGVAAAKDFVDRGAKVILFACTGFSTIGLSNLIRQDLPVPIIDAVDAAGLFASAFYSDQS
ncbi:hydantoin racemase [Bacillus sp. S3]|uniref:aspartate/glutamate racemase family protein n=1 Tax=Bacillus sp. S3 TaxID=486398 RepID=UPI001188E781|nr:aspartate/glutamate racemase family protein [Bacillus sp. S3]QCJ40610.1 hydantoin racemase [Bacillus sp. S3]